MNKKSFTIDVTNVGIYVDEMAGWIADMVKLYKKEGIVIGMSGGVNCTATEKICQIAGVKIHLIITPCGGDMEDTLSDEHAMELLKTTIPNMTFCTIVDILPIFDKLNINSLSINTKESTVELEIENAKSRVRKNYICEYAEVNNLLIIDNDNLSKITIGHFTEWKTGAPIINPFALITQTEVYTILKYLRFYKIPKRILNKKSSFESKLKGLTCEEIDKFILKGTSGKSEVDYIIRKRIEISKPKDANITIFNISA